LGLKNGRDYKMRVVNSRVFVEGRRVGILFTHALARVSGQEYHDNQNRIFRDKN
jgi:hypothetical protein